MGSQLDSTAISSVELFINGLQRKPPHSAAEESLVKCMFEPFIIKEDDKSQAIRNPVLNSFCCNSPHSFPQVHHLLSGNRQPFLELRAGGYQLCPACWEAHAVRQEEPKERASSTLCLKSSLHFRISTSSHSWSVVRSCHCSGREAGRTQGILAKQRGGGRLTCADSQEARKATWKPASWLSKAIKDKNMKYFRRGRNRITGLGCIISCICVTSLNRACELTRCFSFQCTALWRKSETNKCQTQRWLCQHCCNQSSTKGTVNPNLWADRSISWLGKEDRQFFTPSTYIWAKYQ